MEISTKQIKKRLNTVSKRVKLHDYLSKYSDEVERQHLFQVKLWRRADGIVEFVEDSTNCFFEKYFLSLNERTALVAYLKQLSKHRELPTQVASELQNLS